MRVLILGGNGMLGHKLVQILGSEFETFSTIRRELPAVERFGIFDRERTITNVDVTSERQVVDVIDRVRPDVVINCVGIIKQITSTPETMVQINTVLPRKLAELSAKYHFRLILISTDCVFAGSKGNYSEADVPDADDIYGKTKLRGEVVAPNCLTIRTSMFGRELDSSHSLIEWFLSMRNQTISGFTRAIYSGFSTIVLSEIISSLIKDRADLSGLYHISSDPISKFELLELVNDAFEANVTIKPDDSLIIDRSLDSTKFRSETGFVPPTWPEMIKLMAADTTPYESFHSSN
ncbi:MAG: SDR family oxidoreductase [Acidobacteria bacterium]|nr:SDR family oxidoreductase [Acidobacteriota bacterium]MBK9530142.1 SDR family oxidoreductase [Acidobacteriota bacterium]MBP9109047.1 SDR family oxidoreductase [Pyrinomonadaceae bacterium]